MLNNKEKAYLRQIALSNKDLIKFNIGKESLNNSFLESLKNALTKHEIVKVSFLKTSFSDKDDKNRLILDLISSLNCDLVDNRGNVIILYKANNKLKNHIIIPKTK